MTVGDGGGGAYEYGIDGAGTVVCKAVVQTDILYGSDIWVMTDAMLNVLEGFQNHVARRIAGMSYRRFKEGVC